MPEILLTVIVVAFFVWLLSGKRRRRDRAPEDDFETPIDHAELAEAERELADDPKPRSLSEGVEDDRDDWGPGAAPHR